MSETNFSLIGVLWIGIGATACLDIWTFLMQRVFNIPSLNFCFVGRWIGHMSEGVFAHANIKSAPEKTHECMIGWGAHYVIGVIFAAILITLGPEDWLQQPTAWPALLIGLVTVCVPFFIMQPALGLGIAAAKTPAPNKARLKSIVSHLVFGAGLYFSAAILSYLDIHV